MTRATVHPGIGWIGLATYVVAWDLLIEVTLSSHAHRHRRVTAVVGATVLLHLLDVIPKRADPIHFIGRLRGAPVVR